MTEQIADTYDGQALEEFVLAEVVRISRALSQFHRDNAELAERTERRLEAVTSCVSRSATRPW